MAKRKTTKADDKSTELVEDPGPEAEHGDLADDGAAHDPVPVGDPPVSHGSALVGGNILVLDLSEAEALAAAAVYTRAIRQSNPALAAQLAPIVGINLSRP